MKPCGTPAAYRRHLYHGTEPCEACRQANTDYVRGDRHTKGIHRPYKKPVCGTVGGWNAHQYRNTVPCTPCRLAHNQYMKDWRTKLRTKTRRGTILDVVEDYMETHQPFDMPELVLLIQGRHPDLTTGAIRRAAYRMFATGRLDRGSLTPKDPEWSSNAGW